MRSLKVKLRITSNWHREAIGGRWDEIGRLQFEFLVKQGLKPEHLFLDIGCGSLRGGVHFIAYLNKGHYFGIEKESSLLEAGRDVELERYGLEHKKPRLFLIDDFDLAPIQRGVQFDYMLAQSVFTHLTPDSIELCLMRVLPYLKPDGVFYATFYESEEGKIRQGMPHLWRKNERTAVSYPFSMFQTLSESAKARVKYVGDWKHPRNQKMLAFSRAHSAPVDD